jgi:hypothetical protein
MNVTKNDFFPFPVKHGVYKRYRMSQVRWLTPAILATQESQVERIAV